VDGLWATKSEGVGLIARAISFQVFRDMSCGRDPPTSQTDGQTDGWRTSDDMHRNRPTSLFTVGLIASRGKNCYNTVTRSNNNVHDNHKCRPIYKHQESENQPSPRASRHLNLERLTKPTSCFTFKCIVLQLLPACTHDAACILTNATQTSLNVT